MFSEIIDKVKDKMERNLTLDRNANYSTDDQMLVNLFLGLVLEASEVANEFHKCKTVDEYLKVRNRAQTEEEMGDVFFYWLALSIKLGLDPNVIVKRNIEKMDERYLKMLEKLAGSDNI